MRAFTLERDEKTGIKRHSARRIDVDLGDPSANAFGIELVVERRVERVGHVDAAAVAADLEHLRRAVDLAGPGMRRARGHSADSDRAGLARVKWIAHIVLFEFARAPARSVEELVVETERDFGNQGRRRLELLERRRQ